jgi:hypothetical protein
MFKNKSLQVKVVKDKDVGEEVVLDECHAYEISDAVVYVLKEGSNTAVKLITVYVALDTWRKLVLLAAKR